MLNSTFDIFLGFFKLKLSHFNLYNNFISNPSLLWRHQVYLIHPPLPKCQLASCCLHRLPFWVILCPHFLSFGIGFRHKMLMPSHNLLMKLAKIFPIMVRFIFPHNFPKIGHNFPRIFQNFNLFSQYHQLASFLYHYRLQPHQWKWKATLPMVASPHQSMKHFWALDRRQVFRGEIRKCVDNFIRINC